MRRLLLLLFLLITSCTPAKQHALMQPSYNEPDFASQYKGLMNASVARVNGGSPLASYNNTVYGNPYGYRTPMPQSSYRSSYALPVQCGPIPPNPQYCLNGRPICDCIPGYCSWGFTGC